MFFHSTYFLPDNQTSALGASYIAEALKQNSSLTKLDLKGYLDALGFSSFLQAIETATR